MLYINIFFVSAFFLEFTATPDNETIVTVDDNVTLTCEVAHSQLGTVTITWLRNGTLLNVTGAVLEIPNVQQSDTGIYQCVAELSETRSSITALTYLLVQCKLL